MVKAISHTRQTSFKALLIKQLVLAICLSMLISIPLVSIPAFLYIKGAINSDVERIHDASYESINTHLTTGFKQENLDNLILSLKQKLPNAEVSFQKSETFRLDSDQVIQPTSPERAQLIQLIKQAEKQESVVSETDLSGNRNQVVMPIKYQTSCIECKLTPLGTGENYTGALFGVMVIQAPVSLQSLTAGTAITFFIILVVLFILIAVLFTNRMVNRNLVAPLENLSSRIKQLKLSSHERHIDWQRTPQDILEIDYIDESISSHIGIINQVYDKLDALVVTEHETGLYHKDRFNEVIRYEMFRSHRYVRPFSLLIIKLENVRPLNSTAKNIEVESPGSKYLLFGNIIHNDTRETDMAFRLEEQIFAIIAPETDDNGIAKVQSDLYRRLSTNQLPENGRVTAMPEYEFIIKLGTATYFCDDNTSAKEIMTHAITNMQQSAPITGHYPPGK